MRKKAGIPGFFIFCLFHHSINRTFTTDDMDGKRLFIFKEETLMNNYRYFMEKGKVYRIHVEIDTYSDSPREWSNVSRMVCWHRNYSLGDEHNYTSPEDFLNNLVRENIKEATIINFVKRKKTSNGLELRYNRSEKLWELWGFAYRSLFGEKHEPKFQCLESIYPLNYLLDDIVEAMSFEDKWKLLERHAGIIHLPLYLYDHSGITMNTTGFSCKWDSGQVGYAYVSKEDIYKEGIRAKGKSGRYVKTTDRNWKNAAHAVIEDEVSTYDMYLKNEVYGYIVDKQLEDGSWEELHDSCWGFYSENYGDELIEEIAGEYTNAELFDELEELAA